MNILIKPTLFRLSLITLSLYYLSACAIHYGLTEKEISDYLHTQLPVSSEAGIKGILYSVATLEELSVELGRTAPDTATLSATGQIKIEQGASTSQIQIQVSVNTVPYLDPKSGKIYAKQLSLNNINLSPEQYQQQLERYAPLFITVLRNYLEHNPIYQLPQHNNSIVATPQLKQLIVKKGVLQLNWH